MYKLGLKLWSINTDFYYKEAIKLYKRNLFNYIELYMVPDTLEFLSKWQELNTNLKIPFIIHCPHFAHGFNLAKAEKKESNKKIFYEVQKYADTLNAKYIVIHGGIDGNIEETAKQLSELNEPRGLIENKPFIALPNRMNGEFCRGYSPDEIKIVMDIANCGFCLDFGHAICAANSLGEEIYTYCENFMKLKPKMFHLTDNQDIKSPYDSHLHLGTGELNLEKIKKILPDSAIITLETVKNSKENLDDFVEDSKCMNNII